MLKTNSKIVRERVRAYIKENTRNNGEEFATYEEARAYLREDYFARMGPLEVNGYPPRWIFETFKENYASSLGNDLFDYYVCGDTVALVGDMLEQSEAQRRKYTDGQACDLLSFLIFREVFLK